MNPDDFSTMAGPREPRAEIRQAAASMRELYIALTNEGFAPDEALKLLGAMLAAGQQGKD